MNLHPQELEEKLRDAKDEGYRLAMQHEDRRVADLKEELRNYKALLWAAAMTSKPTSLRINPVARNDYGPDCWIRLDQDLATGDLLMVALKGNA